MNKAINKLMKAGSKCMPCTNIASLKSSDTLTTKQIERLQHNISMRESASLN
ncbi:MAG: hypothetical protein H0A75_01305 [Candidatus Methanofishera endochildressiae]|uniref:Uncharacterized protein n=1 Tax=Candidatus Methanofishera endochildressiae TaxID=2738884 RepID=A0A7Z0MMY5_9GAMM|nr:hypothetical protein [Candidatus Methanofishera endochildressiae]